MAATPALPTTHPLPARRRAAGVLLAAALALPLSGASLPVHASAAAADSALRRVVVTGGSALALSTTIERAGGTVLARLSLIGAVGADLPAGAELPAPYVVVPDRPMGVASAAEPTQARVSTVRATLGLGPAARQGRGVTVAVVDTGVQEVQDLRGRVRHVDVTGTGTQDGYGHGTFIAGLIAGDGSASDGANAGIAPGASVLDVKVADDTGSSSLLRVLTGLQAAANDRRVDVINLSLSSHSPLPYQLDPLAAALDRLWERGITVVVPAGNDGDANGTLASPGVDPTLLTVAALDEHGTAGHDDDTVAAFSSRGGRGQRNPDLAAPGTSLLSTLAEGSAVQAAQTRTDLPAGYGAGSGTSFSTAVTSGAAAVLLAERRLQPDQVKRLLRSTAYRPDALADRRAAGAGGLDLAAALVARTPRAEKSDDALDMPAGQARRWQDVVDALNAGDRDAAARAWNRLGDRQQAWAAALWDARSPAASNWAASMWAASNWAGADGTAEQWQARIWAASNWAASNWAASNWAASNWAASNWATTWSASNWAASNWAASNWAASNWAASNWAADGWR